MKELNGRVKDLKDPGIMYIVDVIIFIAIFKAGAISDPYLALISFYLIANFFIVYIDILLFTKAREFISTRRIRMSYGQLILMCLVVVSYNVGAYYTYVKVDTQLTEQTKQFLDGNHSLQEKFEVYQSKHLDDYYKLEDIKVSNNSVDLRYLSNSVNKMNELTKQVREENKDKILYLSEVGHGVYPIIRECTDYITNGMILIALSNVIIIYSLVAVIREKLQNRKKKEEGYIDVQYTESH